MRAAVRLGQHVGVGLHDAGLVARTLHGGEQLLRVRTGFGLDLRLFGRQVDAGRLHTGHAAQGLLHPGHARGAGHPVDVQGVLGHAHTLSSGHSLLAALNLTRHNMTIELTLPDMTCGHCAKTVTATVQQVDPAAQLTIDLPTHKVVIESQLPQQAFAAALTEEGYAPA